MNKGIFEPLVERVLQSPYLKKRLFQNWELNQKLQMLNPGENGDKLLWKFRTQQGVVMCKTGLLCCLLIGILRMSGLVAGKGDKIFMLYLLAAVLPLGLAWLLQNRLEERKRKREQQLLLDYPELINKFVLLLGAGLTIKGTVNRLLEEQKGKTFRYSYAELLVTSREINNGISEAEAFERMGNRIRMIPYMRLGSLVSQNLKKGTAELIPLLELEAADAFSQRKEHAKRIGEEASTKMLFPMMLMLGIVMAMIMIPAFMTL